MKLLKFLQIVFLSLHFWASNNQILSFPVLCIFCESGIFWAYCMFGMQLYWHSVISF
jgi:hypothetical protein